MSQMNGDGTVFARGLRKSFGDRVVLDSIDLDVACGEIVCIIGPSGSGKSTLLRCVDGLEEIDRGVLRVNGEDLGFRETSTSYQALKRKEVAAQRTRIGMVFQSFNLFPNMTAQENVMSGPVLVKGAPKAESRRRAASSAAPGRRSSIRSPPLRAIPSRCSTNGQKGTAASRRPTR